MRKRTIAIYGIQDRHDFKYPGYTHDHSVCIMEDGVIKDYLHLERLTRRKYDNRMPLYIDDLIQNGSILVDQNTEFVFVNSFVGDAFISSSGNLRFEANFQEDFTTTIHKGRFHLQDHWEEQVFPGYSIAHELAHIGSCIPFFGAFKENSLLLHFDGGASLGNFSAIHYKNGKLVPLECHWELSHLSKFFNSNALTFGILGAKPGEHCSVAGKLMGYAALGNYRPELLTWLRTNGYFKSIWDAPSDFYRSAKQQFGWTGSIENQKDPFLADIAAAFQVEFQQGILGKIEALQKKTEAEHLYYAGGCALNIVTNSALVNSGWFKNVYIPPCCNDSGLSIGAAAFAQWSKGIQIAKHTPFLNTIGTEVSGHSVSKRQIKEVAEFLNAGNVLAVCNGPGEAGPRALGNRSILALANSKSLADKVSQIHKGREWYRPIAPMMLEHNAKLVTGQSSIHHLADYMLLEFPILPTYHSLLEGVVHANGTSRIQVVREDQNSFLYQLLKLLKDEYGHLALINTSFNQRGAPMVHTAKDALESAQAMKLDGLLLQGKFINLTPQHHELEGNKTC